MSRKKKKKFTLCELQGLLDKYETFHNINSKLGYSTTSMRQQWLVLNGKCIKCRDYLDKKGTFCSKCLIKQSIIVKLNQTTSKVCNKCPNEILRNSSQSNLSWGKKKTCKECIEIVSKKCIKEHYYNNREKKLSRGKTSEAKTYQKKYRNSKIGKAKRLASNSKRRAQKTTTATGYISEYIELLLLWDNGKCRYCNSTDKLTIEHILPLSRGGRHSECNVDLACSTCNGRKGSKTEKEFKLFIEQMENIMARSASVDPLSKFRFSVSFGGLTRAGFTSCSLPTESNGEIQYREGNYRDTHEKSPGLTSYSDISLSRGVTTDQDLYLWADQIKTHNATVRPSGDAGYGAGDERPEGEASNNFRREVTITLLDREGQGVKQWIIYNAHLAEFNPGDGLDANAEEKLINSMTLRHEGFKEIVL